jgi:hypothetical protein
LLFLGLSSFGFVKMDERMSRLEIIVNSSKEREYTVSTMTGMAIDDTFMFNMDMKMIGLSSYIQGNLKESYGFDDNREFWFTT